MLIELNMRKTSKAIRESTSTKKRISDIFSTMHSLITCSLLLSLTASINALSLPFISNVIFKPLNDFTNSTSLIRINRTCQQCLCDFLNSGWNQSYVALNCHPNQTCQFFNRFAPTYSIQTTSGAALYFLQNQYPSASSCCMPNITELINRLKSATSRNISLGFQPSVFGYDPITTNETVIVGRNGAWAYRFGLSPLAWIRNTSIVNTSVSIALHSNQIYTASDGVPSIKVYDDRTSNLLLSINHPTLTRVRKMIFINNGQNMVVTAQDNQSLIVFDIHSLTNYTVQRILPFPAVGIHGLVQVNDTFLYAGSWNDRAIISYKYENSSWTARSFVTVTAGTSGSHLAVDDCGRVWFIIIDFGLRIYDSSGVEIANWNMATGSSNLYDLLLLPNYVLLLTLRQAQQLVRFDPQVSCS